MTWKYFLNCTNLITEEFYGDVLFSHNPQCSACIWAELSEQNTSSTGPEIFVQHEQPTAAVTSGEPELPNSLVETQHQPEVLIQTLLTVSLETPWMDEVVPGLTPHGLMGNQKLTSLECKTLLPNIWRMLFQETPIFFKSPKLASNHSHCGLIIKILTQLHHT